MRRMHLVIVVFALPVVVGLRFEEYLDSFEFKHHDNEEVRSILMDVHYKCRNISRVFALKGHAVSGDKIYGITFGMYPRRHKPLIPEFKYLGNIHGNEVVGKEMLLRLATFLCSSYLQRNPEIVKLLQVTRIHLLPSINPDGWYEASASPIRERNHVGGRNNLNDVDLNRDFPDVTRIYLDSEAHGFVEEMQNHHLLQFVPHWQSNRQPETHALIRFIMSEPFVLSGCLHGGELVANYPFDESPLHPLATYSASPDDKVFRSVSKTYADAHPKLGAVQCLNYGKNFIASKGITNGAEWYSLAGGMQDFNYLATNCFEVTLEISCVKYPPANTLSKFWEDQKRPLLNFMWQTHMGIKGIVSDAESGKPLKDAVIHVAEYIKNMLPKHIWHDITSVKRGDYYRLLVDGEYIVTVSKHGYYTHSKRVTVYNSNNIRNGGAQVIDFELIPIK